MKKVRKDEVNPIYKKVNILKNIGNIIFIFVFLFSIIVLLDFKYRNIFVLVLIIVTIANIIISNINDIYLIYFAEEERRKSLIKESFDINITLKETKNYYNNKEKPSLKKLGLNSMESVFFTKRIVDKMMPIEMIKSVVCLLIYVFLLIVVKDLNVILLVTQTIFSAELIIGFLKFCFFKMKVDKLYDELKNLFCVVGVNESTEILLLCHSINYECVKSYYKVLVSSKIFKKYNDKWTIEWKNMLKKLRG